MGHKPRFPVQRPIRQDGELDGVGNITEKIQLPSILLDIQYEPKDRKRSKLYVWLFCD